MTQICHLANSLHLFPQPHLPEFEIVMMSAEDYQSVMAALEEIAALLKRLDLVVGDKDRRHDEFEEIYMKALIAVTRTSGVLQRVGVAVPIPPLIDFTAPDAVVQLEIRQFFERWCADLQLLTQPGA